MITFDNSMSHRMNFRITVENDRVTKCPLAILIPKFIFCAFKNIMSFISFFDRSTSGVVVALVRWRIIAAFYVQNEYKILYHSFFVLKIYYYTNCAKELRISLLFSVNMSWVFQTSLNQRILHAIGVLLDCCLWNWYKNWSVSSTLNSSFPFAIFTNQWPTS